MDNREAAMMERTEERQKHRLVFDDSAQVVMPELVLPTLRPMCKTNPNDARGPNRKISFFPGKNEHFELEMSR